MTKSFSKEEVDMRVATVNVENMFERAKAMNFSTWAAGKAVLEDFKRLNELIQEDEYTGEIKSDLLDIMKRQESDEVRDERRLFPDLPTIKKEVGTASDHAAMWVGMGI